MMFRPVIVRQPYFVIKMSTYNIKVVVDKKK